MPNHITAVKSASPCIRFILSFESTSPIFTRSVLFSSVNEDGDSDNQTKKLPRNLFQHEWTGIALLSQRHGWNKPDVIWNHHQSKNLLTICSEFATTFFPHSAVWKMFALGTMSSKTRDTVHLNLVKFALSGESDIFVSRLAKKLHKTCQRLTTACLFFEEVKVAKFFLNLVWHFRLLLLKSSLQDESLLVERFAPNVQRLQVVHSSGKWLLTSLWCHGCFILR